MSAKLNISVYTRDLEFIGVIDDYSSLIWRRKYYAPGEFELHTSLDQQTIRYLKKDNIIVREDAQESGIIESYLINDSGNKGIEVIIYGRFLSSILERRIVKTRINYSGNILDGERIILNSMTPFSRLTIPSSTLSSERIRFQVTYKNVGNYLNKLAKRSTIAHRIKADILNKQFIYENYQGLDRTEAQAINSKYEFSENKSNITSAKYTYSTIDEQNYALVGGEGDGNDRIVVEVTSGNFTDLDLRETFVDASSEIMEEDMTLEEYKEILNTKGNERMTDAVETFEVSVHANDYKKQDGWDLGDIVNVKKESWNISQRKRIVEVEEIYEKNSQKIYATFGSPLAETIDDD